MNSIQTTWPQQCFVLGAEVIDAVSFEELDATWADMEEVGVAKPPFESFDLVVPWHKIIRLQDADGKVYPAPQAVDRELRVRYFNGGKQCHWLMCVGKLQVDLIKEIKEITKGFGGLPPDETSWADSAGNLLRLLIVVLATKNVVKERKECKMVKLGIGAKHRNRYTTTIKLGRITEATEGEGTGTERRPHLRRGHVRRQHHGPNNELVKLIFIEPVFVNADKGWIAERTAYNVST